MVLSKSLSNLRALNHQYDWGFLDENEMNGQLKVR